MQCVCNYFPTKVTCGDSWSMLDLPSLFNVCEFENFTEICHYYSCQGNGLILGTEEGVFKLEGKIVYNLKFVFIE